MIVGTAGHIDHGKTRLVAALTGVDTDRLAEEQRRGITIELGFAYTALPDGGRIGFVDVPGHERLVRTMVAGAGGIDAALLVVAADDGVMPQTREHLAILDLLGVRRGVVALSKADLASPQRRAEVSAQIEALLAGTGLAGAGIVPVSTVTGEGIAALSTALAALAPAPGAAAEGGFRLAVDRSFTMTGAGTVVTGMVHAGTIAVGAEVVISPSGLPARVREVRADGRRADRAVAGQRVALNLAGPDISREAIHRGDEVVELALHAPTARIDARLRLLAGEARGLASGTQLRLHTGTAEALVRVVPLGPPAEPGGAPGWVQLVLDRPIATAWGRRFVLRDSAGTRTLGGGTLADLRPPARRRALPQRLAALAARALPDPAAALSGLLQSGDGLADLDAFSRDRGLPEAAVAAALAQAGAVTLGPAGQRTALQAAALDRLRASIAETLGMFHVEHPDLQGLGRERLRLGLDPRLPLPAFGALLQTEAAAGSLSLEGGFVRLAGHAPRLTPEDEALFAAMAPALSGEGRFRPPRVRDFAATLEVDEREVRRALRLCARLGRVDEIARDHFFARAVTAEMAGIVRRLSSEAPQGWFGAPAFRDEVQNGRKVAIEILDFFDRHGLTIRRGDLRRVNLHRAALFD